MEQQRDQQGYSSSDDSSDLVDTTVVMQQSGYATDVVAVRDVVGNVHCTNFNVSIPAKTKSSTITPADKLVYLFGSCLWFRLDPLPGDPIKTSSAWSKSYGVSQRCSGAN